MNGWLGSFYSVIGFAKVTHLFAQTLLSPILIPVFPVTRHIDLSETELWRIGQEIADKRPALFMDVLTCKP